MRPHKADRTIDESKACPVCGETIKAVAIKCRFCNTDLSAYAATRHGEAEKPLFTGHPAVVTSAWQWLAVISGLPGLETLPMPCVIARCVSEREGA